MLATKHMSPSRWIWSCDLLIPSLPGAGRQLRHEMLCQLQQHRWAEHDIFSVHLALEEALVNAIEHGNHLDPRKQVRVVCRISPDLVRIVVSDEGEGFDPSHMPDPTDDQHRECPHGRGVLLMRSFMDRVIYGKRGNRVLLEKRRSRSA
jgi:serine/threonine-protein kinase RsbW